jgi:hypothetical protein
MNLVDHEHHCQFVCNVIQLLVHGLEVFFVEACNVVNTLVVADDLSLQGGNAS